jgi:membrane protein implicated in regulation of membrane protease activity
MLFLIIAILLCIPFAVFALSNMQVVALGIWPTDFVMAFLLGGLIVWLAELGQRRRARRAERTVRLLQAKVDELEARGRTPSLSLPPAA